MTFDYDTLRQVEKECSRLGNWKGKRSQLEKLGSGAYYILYDDENKLVGQDSEYFYSYGTVNESGNVSTRRRYNHVSYTPGYDMNERPMGDVDVEKVLKSAREMSVESLLDGFLSGVSFDVAKG